MLKVEPTGPTEEYKETLRLLNQIADVNMGILQMLQSLNSPQYVCDPSPLTQEQIDKLVGSGKNAPF